MKIELKILMDEKSWKTWKSIQKIVMNEELLQNGVMDEELVGGKFVKNFVMGAKIDPKIAMGVFILKIGGWNILQLSNRKLSEECFNENEPRLSIRIQAEIHSL